MAQRRREDPRLATFKQYVAAHREIQTAHTELLAAILHSSYDLVFVVGATGVGKTTLLRKVERTLVETAKPNAPENRGLVPVVMLEAKAPVGAGFPWSVLFADALRAMGDPHVGTIPLSPVRPETQGTLQVLKRVGSETERYRDAYISALAHRRPLAVLIDEGHSLAGVSAPKLHPTMEVLKSLTNATDVVHVLAGTYAMQPLMWHSGQLARRTKIIHFPPYDADRRGDVDEFASVVEFFEERLPIPAKPKLLAMTESFFAQSGGLVGVLSTRRWPARCRSGRARSRIVTCARRRSRPARSRRSGAKPTKADDSSNRSWAATGRRSRPPFRPRRHDGKRYLGSIAPAGASRRAIGSGGRARTKNRPERQAIPYAPCKTLQRAYGERRLVPCLPLPHQPEPQEKVSP
jgi:hypothetical protein